MTALQQVEERQNVDKAVFENDILPSRQPVVLRGLVRNWPAVEAGQGSLANVVDYFRGLDAGGTVSAMVSPPENAGRFFYAEDYEAFNFGMENVSISAGLGALASFADDPRPPAIALQAMHTPDLMPAFPADNPMPLLDNDVVPRIWMSNRSMIAPHFDNNFNIACVVSGRRRFTIFPPEQVENLYIGPLLKTPGGAPISVVDVREPDFERFPRYREALASAREAVLEPGDAIYIPILWWHGVESLDALNILVNYWWNPAPSRHKPILALIHSMALLSAMPPEQRDIWRTFFEHFAFQAGGDPGEHLPPGVRDVMGKLTAEERTQLLDYIRERMRD